MDACLYVQCQDEKIIYEVLEISRLDVQSKIDMAIDKIKLLGNSIKFVMIEVFKYKHVIIYKDLSVNIDNDNGLIAFDIDDLYDKIEGNKEAEKFLNSCLLIKLDFEKIQKKDKERIRNHELFKNRLN